MLGVICGILGVFCCTSWYSGVCFGMFWAVEFFGLLILSTHFESETLSEGKSYSMLLKRDVENPIHNTWSKTVAANFFARNGLTRFIWLFYLYGSNFKVPHQGKPFWFIGCREIGSSSFDLCIMNSVSNVPLCLVFWSEDNILLALSAMKKN